MNNNFKKFSAESFYANEDVAKEFYSELMKFKKSLDALESLLDDNYSKEKAMPIYQAMIEVYAIMNTEIEMPILAKFPDIKNEI